MERPATVSSRQGPGKLCLPRAKECLSRRPDHPFLDTACVLVLPFQGCGAEGTVEGYCGLQQNRQQRPGQPDDSIAFGDLQFLHGMANAADIHPVDTRAQILDWLEFAWKVSTKEILPQTYLKDVDNPTIKRHFGCTEWRVVDLYLLGRQDSSSGLISQIREIAFGSVLHTVQDSFAAAHAEREAELTGEQCEGTTFTTPEKIVEFHAYGVQDGVLHDHEDSRDAMTAVATERWPEAVDVTRNLFELHSDGAQWSDASSYLQCVFTLSDHRRASSPGDMYRRTGRPRQ